MSTTSKKHRAFVVEPMGQKSVRELPGIGRVLGGRLEERGYSKSSQVLGKFLALGKNEGAFRAWLKVMCGANTKQQGDCYNCLREWSDSFL